jgi:hypothetical protein
MEKWKTKSRFPTFPRGASDDDDGSPLNPQNRRKEASRCAASLFLLFCAQPQARFHAHPSIRKCWHEAWRRAGDGTWSGRGGEDTRTCYRVIDSQAPQTISGTSTVPVRRCASDRPQKADTASSEQPRPLGPPSGRRGYPPLLLAACRAENPAVPQRLYRARRSMPRNYHPHVPPR